MVMVWESSGTRKRGCHAVVGLSVPIGPFGCVRPLDYGLARHWYEKAAAAGNTIAMTNLAYMYEAGLGVVQNCQTAIDWYKKAAAAGSTNAMYMLGVKYEEEYAERQIMRRRENGMGSPQPGGTTEL